MSAKEKILKSIEEALEKRNINKKVILTESKNFGDFATNIALTLTKEMNKDSMEIAEIIVQSIDKEKYDIEKIEIAKPGFINFYVKGNIFVDEVNKILKEGQKYGSGKKEEKINVEFVSVNPTGFLHLGHARGAAIGATLSNVLEFAGYDVVKEYYINDAGNQIDILGISVFTRYKQSFGYKLEMPEDSYIGEDIKWVASVIKEEIQDKYLNKSYEESKEYFKNRSVEILMSQIKKDLAAFNVEFDKFSSEKKLYEENKITSTLEKLKGVYTKDGATWLKTTDFGDDKDRVLIKNDSSFTYFTPDIAYHDQKMLADGGVDKLINIWGADHSGYVKRMETALKLLGYDTDNKFKVLLCQLVRLMKDGQEFKMSKRKGNAITIRELVELVGKDAVRFFMIDRSENSPLDFDIDLAKNRTQNNPVFMIQYAHARISQLLAKSEVDQFEAYEFKNANEIKLINNLKDFPELISKISTNYKIHLLPQYLIKLASDFNSFYSNSKILGDENEKSLLALAKATQIVLKTGLDLIGVSAPERM